MVLTRRGHPIRRRLGRRRAWLLPAALVAAAVVAAGCGVPTGGTPRAIPKSQVPFPLLDPQVPTTPPSTAPTGEPVKVYFLNGTETYVTPRTRLVGPKATLTTILGELLRGPYTNEIVDDGVRTAITSGVQLLRTAVIDDKDVTVDFNQAFGEISGTQQILAVAQVVYTIAARFPIPAAVEVQFELNGTAIEVPNANGAEVQGPVTTQDYVTLTPLAAASGTTTTTAPTTTTTTTTAAAG